LRAPWFEVAFGLGLGFGFALGFGSGFGFEGGGERAPPVGGQVAPERMELVAISCISRNEIAVCAPREPIPGSRSTPAEPEG